VRDGCIAESVCVRAQESREAIEDAVDTRLGACFAGIGGGGLESPWGVEGSAGEE
jgi:hypothetical protein